MIEDSEFASFDNSTDIFKDIDRDQEDKDVMEYQRTKDDAILTKIYHDRIPTLRYWGKKFHYLMKLSVDNSYRNAHDVDEMVGELTRVFIKAIHGYKDSYKCSIDGKVITKKTPFNTYLFFSFENYIKNLRSNKSAKKRRPIDMDPKITHNLLLSLDFNYSSDDGEGLSLKDKLCDKNTLTNSATDKMYLEETIDLLAKEDATIKKFLVDLSDGSTLIEVLRKYKTKKGKIKLNNKQTKQLKGKGKHNKVAKEIINSSADFEHDFKVIEYDVVGTKLVYTIEMEKTKETDNIIRSIRKFRKNKAAILSKINDI